MNIETRPYRVLPGKLRLAKRPTGITPLCDSDEAYAQRLKEQIEAMRPLQERLFADNRYALLLIFQAMDAAGKDGTIKHVFSGLNPQGCQVFSFRHPTADELDHDFLWRTSRFLPERGRIGIFNRSYYEEVLIVRVQPEILKAQRIPDLGPASATVWRDRYRSILDHEAHLTRNGTRVVKFFLHLSREEQRKRFLKRIDDPRKNWKFTTADLEARARWDDYQRAYEDCLSATSTRHAPWYVIPADHKPDARLLVSQILLDTLAGLDIKPPKADAQQKKAMRKARKKLLAEEPR
jgi:PPK2 family polyphosphate:nucleotide phosphotransferase